MQVGYKSIKLGHNEIPYASKIENIRRDMKSLKT